MQRDCRPSAKAVIKGGEALPHLSGEVRFYRDGRSVLIVARIEGLPPTNTGFFGFHIHEGDSCQGTDFDRTGGHLNPGKQPHPEHMGDLPPLLSCNGRAYMQVTTDRFCIQDIIGKTVVIHGDSDDFRTQPAGNAGKKIACGVIRPTSCSR